MLAPLPIRRTAYLASIVDLEFWLVTAAVAAGTAVPDLLPYALGVAALFWPLRWVVARRFTARTPADLPILVLLVLVPVTLWATALPEVTLPQVYRLLAGIALYYAFVNWARSLPRVYFLMLGLAAVGTIFALLAPFAVEWSLAKLPFIPASLYDRFQVLFADAAHPNVMGGYIVLLLPIALALPLYAFRHLGWIHRIWLVGASGLMLVVLVLTKSRGGWLALLAALLLLIVLRWRWGWFLVPVSFAAGAVLVYRFGVGTLLDLLSTGGVVSTVENRLEIWSRAIYMLQDFPFTGIGMGSFMRVADLLYPFFLAAPGTIVHAHNLFLQIGVDLGIPGLVAWLAVLFTVIYSSYLVYRHGKMTDNPLLTGIGAGLLASIAGLAVHGLTDAVVWGMVRPAPIVWAVWAVPVAAAIVTAQQSTEPSS